MNYRLPTTLALAVALLSMVDSTFLTAGTVTGVTVGAGTLAAGAAVVGALALGAALGVGKRRGKREAVSCLPFSNPELYFSMAANADFLNCGRRFLCEVEATPEQNLAEEEKSIRDVFARGSTSINGSAGTFYAEAANIGATGGVAACVKTFSSCPLDRKTIFLAFQDAKKVQ